MVRKIVTHGGQAHADDLLAVAVLLVKYPKAEIYRADANYVEDKETVFIDTGNKYDGVNFFDHHHDSALPASLILVLKEFFPEVPTDIDEVQWISDWDTIGPFRAQQRWRVKMPEFRDPISETILRIFSKENVIRPGDEAHQMLLMIGREFIEFLREQKKFIDKAEKAETFEVKGLKVVRVNENVPVRFIKKVHPDAAIVIQPNQRTAGAVTLTRVDDHPRVDFRRISVPAYFVHSNGFMAVVDPQYISKALMQAID